MLSNAPEFVVLLLGLLSSAGAVAVPQATPKQGQTFQLFAYGDGDFSGYPIFYRNSEYDSKLCATTTNIS